MWRKAVVVATVVAAVSVAAAADAGLFGKPHVIHCRYTAIVLQRERFEAFALCTGAYTGLRVDADRPFLIRASNTTPNLSSYLACKNHPKFGQASQHARCEGSVRGNERLAFQAGTTTLCDPIRISFAVTSPFENAATLTLRSHC